MSSDSSLSSYITYSSSSVAESQVADNTMADGPHVGQGLHPKTRHMLSLNAFHRHKFTIPLGQTFTTEVDNWVRDWLSKTLERTIITVDKTYNSLVHDSSWVGLLPDVTNDKENINYFSYIPSYGGFLEIKDNEGHILGFRFPITPFNLAILKETEKILYQKKAATTGVDLPEREHQEEILSHEEEFIQSQPDGEGYESPGPSDPHKRGAFRVRHWGVWADYGKEFRMTKQLEEDLAFGAPWLAANQGLFQEVSNVLRMVDPDQYIHCRNDFKEKMAEVDGPDGNPLQPAAGVWHALAVNLNQVGVGVKTHVDWKDTKSVFNCLIPWGNWTGGDLVLWPLKMRIQILEGEGFFFLGAITAHCGTEIDGMCIVILARHFCPLANEIYYRNSS